MKILFLVLILFFNAKYCSSQYKSEEDSLIKYSYFLQGYTDSTMSTISQGTGFFINNNGQNMLVTAKHVLSGCKFNGKKDTGTPDEMMLYFNEDEDLHFRSFSLDLKEIKDTAQCLQYYVSPDVISYPVTDTSEKEIYPIDNFLPSYLPPSNGKIVIFGFPSFNNIDSGKYFVRPARKLEIINYDLHETFIYQDPGGSLVTDTINYTIRPQDVLMTANLKGYSGSPVFMKDEDKAKWVFLGIIIAIDDKNNLLTIVKPKNLFEKIGYLSTYTSNLQIGD